MPGQPDLSAPLAVYGLLLLPHAGLAELERELQRLGLYGLLTLLTRVPLTAASRSFT